MKKILFLFSVATLSFISCNKSSSSSTLDCNKAAPTATASAQETTFINSFLTAANITNAVEKNGMFYVLRTQGTGVSPNICSQLTVTYKGELFNSNGTFLGIFDETTNGNSATFGLSDVIVGWQLVFPLVKAGGTIDIYIPPSLGYGTGPRSGRTGTSSNGNPYVGIPANSYMKFTVFLSDVQ